MDSRSQVCRPGSFNLCLQSALLSILLEYPPSVTRHLRCDTRSADYRVLGISFRGHSEIDAGELRRQELFVVLFCGTKSIDVDLRFGQQRYENGCRNQIQTSVN
jgi:hypothetical protein